METAKCQLEPKLRYYLVNEIGIGNRMEKLGKTWQRQHLYRRMARFRMKKSCGRNFGYYNIRNAYKLRAY